MDKYEAVVRKILGRAGVELNGSAPDAIRVHNPGFYKRVVLAGNLGAGESYMDGWWDCDQLDVALTRILRLGHLEIRRSLPLSNQAALLGRKLLSFICNFQSISRSRRVGKEHYDLGNDLFEAMLDSHMQYTCGYWNNATTLEEAQEHKLKLICTKLRLEPGMRLLDIGCGWGGLLRYAAQNYGVSGVGITISKEQAELARQRCVDYDVEIRLQDYRLVEERFDRVVSVGMFEHVGWRNYKTYMAAVRKMLANDDSLFLLQTIGNNRSLQVGDAWLDKYIFANGMIPSAQQIAAASEGLLLMEDWHNFSLSYDKTLMSWYKNFVENWGSLQQRYSERFYRMWTFYLLSCAANFRARQTQLWQVLFSVNASQNYGDSARFTFIR